MEPEPRKELIQPGDGTTFPKVGETVCVHYTGYLISGKKYSPCVLVALFFFKSSNDLHRFDSSYDRGRVFETPIGHQKVIKGVDIVLEFIVIISVTTPEIQLTDIKFVAWDTLILQMSKGEIAKLYCPA